jgi:hypothetical protein
MDKKTIRHKLCNDFPSVYIRDINTALTINKYSYVGSYYYLEEQIKSNGLVLKKKPLKKKDIDSDTLTKFETLFNSVKSTIECSCCCDDKTIEDFGQCTDGHLICKKCIKTHAENTIYQQLSCKVNCIDCNAKCFGEFDEDTLTIILEPRVLSEYKNLKKITEIKELCIDDINIKLCQHCGAGTDIGNIEQYLLVCMECFKDTCLKCNQVDHPGKPCHSLGNIVQNKRQEIEDKMTEALIVKCNKCNTSIFKNEGCNKVTCVCGTHNCYICKETITKAVGYSHFCREHNCKKNNGSKCDMCHLWEQNTKNRVLNAVKDEYTDETKKLIDGLL